MYSMLQDRTISVEKGKDRNVNFREKFRKNVCYVGVFCKNFNCFEISQQQFTPISNFLI